jgi:hypothetical protein
MHHPAGLPRVPDDDLGPHVRPNAIWYTEFESVKPTPRSARWFPSTRRTARRLRPTPVESSRSQAVTPCLLGAGLTYPKLSPESVREPFEPAEAERLLSYAETVVAEMNTFEADWADQNLQDAVRARRPELDGHGDRRAGSEWRVTPLSRARPTPPLPPCT